ncbi:MAG: LptF/LptG family permease [Firmicutes bacterium]|nr:LptF/LptG family permease [Bacillota bacterium]MCM1401870.1 LptF/LptG family permease [Bacteroides sp.]MCM1476725.1 LptF/LptG family permease [Bacteroides sp.]
MTFFICLFIVLMQFLWRYIDDLVGKGLTIDVIGELFFYAALTMVPMALPLAILLASLMTFGNLGEHFELTAMKASGVSLIKVMRPLIVLMIGIAIGAFFFQNNMLPIAQTKMWTLLFSMRQKSPELEIPEGVFYDQIPGYNFFVDHKNRETGTLYEIMIYDMSRGFDNAGIILADSGRLVMTEDKSHLFLKLWQGESFDNLKEAGTSMKNVPYRRETFHDKSILLQFDANFNRMDEEGMRNQYVGKNIAQLQATIDSVGHRVDSIGKDQSHVLLTAPRMGVRQVQDKYDKGGRYTQIPVPDVHPAKLPDVDSLMKGPNSGARVNYVSQALNKAKNMQQDYQFRTMVIKDELKTVRRHDIELQKKFTLSFACIIFFFIGAPLGAIIRKGGIGTPLVISVILFIFYYIIDNTGYKMARDGRIAVWEGMWLSSAVLLPLGIFFTYKAVRDSAVFNKDAYLNFFRRLTGSNMVRHLKVKELIMEECEAPRAIEMLTQLQENTEAYLARHPRRPSYTDYWLNGYSRTELKKLSAELENTVAYISNSRSKLVINKLMDFPILRSLWLYHPTNYRRVAWAAIVIFPVGLAVYFAGLYQLDSLRHELQTIISVSKQLEELLGKADPDSFNEPN